MDAKKEIEKLREEIEYHNRLYYVNDAPVISDYDYDMLMVRLTKLEEEHPEQGSFTVYACASSGAA